MWAKRSSPWTTAPGGTGLGLGLCPWLCARLGAYPETRLFCDLCTFQAGQTSIHPRAMTSSSRTKSEGRAVARAYEQPGLGKLPPLPSRRQQVTAVTTELLEQDCLGSILSLPLISCVTLDKSPTLSEPVSSLLNWGAGKSEGED